MNRQNFVTPASGSWLTKGDDQPSNVRKSIMRPCVIANLYEIRFTLYSKKSPTVSCLLKGQVVSGSATEPTKVLVVVLESTSFLKNNHTLSCSPFLVWTAAMHCKIISVWTEMKRKPPGNCLIDKPWTWNERQFLTARLQRQWRQRWEKAWNKVWRQECFAEKPVNHTISVRDKLGTLIALVTPRI